MRWWSGRGNRSTPTSTRRRKAVLRSEPLEERIMFTVAASDYDVWRDLAVSLGGFEEAVSATNAYALSELTPQAAVSSTLINADQVHATYGYTGTGYSVAILDTGIDYNHAALSGNYIGGWDFVDNDADPMDLHGHGTHVAGIIGSTDATYGGIAPDVNLIALRVLDASGSGSFGDVEAALQWVVNNQALYNIVAVNMSLGAGNYSSNPYTFLEDEFASLDSAGVFIASASGNDFYSYGSQPGLAYPAISANTVSVGAVWNAAYGSVTWASGAVDHSTAADRVTSFTQRDASLDLVAPGALVTSTYLGGQFASLAGTSMATPMVAGAAVLVHQALDTAGFGGLADQDYILNQMQTNGISVSDGDDENDNVVNTGLNFTRLDLLGAVSAIQPADIEVISATAAGGTVTISYNVKDAVAAAFEIGLYRSADNAFDGGDTLVGTAQVSDAADLTLGLHAVSFTVGGGAGQLALPGAGAAEASGDYHLLAVADHLGQFEAVTDPSFADNTAALSGVYHIAGGSVFVHGTAGNDTITVSGGGAVNVTLNGQVYSYAGSDTSGVVVRSHDGADSFTFDHGSGFDTYWLGFTFHGGSGADTAQLTGSANNDVGSLYYSFGFMYGWGYFVDVKGATQITIDGGGGWDWVYLYDAVGPDHLVGGANQASIQGMGLYAYSNTAVDVDVVYSQAVNGGANTADLNDSSGNDRFVALPTYGYMADAGFSRFVYAVGFDAVYAHFSTGTDRADFYDSSGDDHFVSRPDSSYMEGAGYHNWAEGYDSAYGFAVLGGNDVADFFDSAGGDHFLGSFSFATLDGPGYYLFAQGFDHVTADSSNGGTDSKDIFLLDYVFDEVGTGTWL